MNARLVSLLVRVLYAALITYAAVLGKHGAVVFSSLVFFGTLVTWWIASRTREERVLYYDALLVCLFAVTLGAGLLFDYELTSTLFGLDKLFHFLAGIAVAGVAWYGAPTIFRTVRSRERLAFVALACMLVFMGWEVYEWLHFAFIQGRDVLALTDSWIDIVVDSAGAWLALRFVAR